MHQLSQLNQSKIIWAVKAFAILSVICAHTAAVPDFNSLANIISGNILKSFGSIGVVFFFIVAGKMFAISNKGFFDFFEKKIKTILIPWFATGTAVYLYVAIRKNGISVTDWINFLVGNKSYLYFLPMLLLCYFIAFLIKNSYTKIAFIMFFSIFSIYLTTTRVIDQINPYLNPFNWFFYFFLGYLFFDKIFFIISFAKKTIFLWITTFLVLLFLFSINTSINYWTSEYLLFELVSVICIFSICSFPIVYQSKIIEKIGKESFSIYLLHMPFAGFIAHMFNKIDFYLLTLIRPFFVLLLTISCISIYRFISCKINVNRLFSILIGLRN